ncbi:hypothetical protein B0T10DRAFT_568420 [Thelonectria olida]|uniref:Nephrocystin 3-like N-terminal domain-containing protein n=1 Tax=Thelonectria olida TaxID=1576542 RepID=A0A9P9AHG3_9HYPO|nr:hypothetical protein B0T10DRAFT_568420 [Thelonectria olida]
MWLYGKPGSVKSVLASQIISFLRSKRDTRVLFFFCDYLSTPNANTARIFRAFAAQLMGIASETIPFFYDEYLAKGRQPSASVLKGALAKVLAEFDDIRLLVDGIDELPASEHKTLINELIQLEKASNHSCKLLISSQDLPSIRPHLSHKLPQKCTLFLGDEKSAIENDVEIIVKDSLEDLNQNIDIAIGPSLIEELRSKILQKSEGMLLWVRLVLSLLESSANLAELRSNVDSLPKDPEAVYKKILNNIQDRCSPSSLARVKRIFGWLIFSNEGSGIMKHEVLIGMSLHEGSDSLNRDNRPFSNALEICKPLIEDGPRGTAAIIHSTVTEHLLSIVSGPFISSLTAHQDIAFACISQLIQVLDHVHSDIPRSDLTTRTALGIFGLQSYANEHWIQHFLQMFEDSTPPSTVTRGSVRDVQHLSQNIDSYPGLSQEELLAFRSNYGHTAFRCPIRRPGRNDSQIPSTPYAALAGQQAQKIAQVQQETAAPQQSLQNSQGAQTQQQAERPVNIENQQQPQRPTSLPDFTPQELASLTPEHRAQYEKLAKIRMDGPIARPGDSVSHLRALSQEEAGQSLMEVLPDIPMSPQEFTDTSNKLQRFVRLRIMKQFKDGEKMNQLKPLFSLRASEIDQALEMLESMAKDLATSVYGPGMMKNSQQQATPNK